MLNRCPQPKRHIRPSSAIVLVWGLLLGALNGMGCVPQGHPGQPDHIIGSRGIGEGRFQKPRAIAIDDEDRLFVVDMTGRIQVMTLDGESLALWRTPETVSYTHLRAHET